MPKTVQRFVATVTRNPVSLIGSVITTTAGVIFVALFFVEVLGHRGGPYLGMLTFIIIPAFFALGLLLIPVGVFIERRRAQAVAGEGVEVPLFPVLDLNSSRVRKGLVLFVAATTVNLVILGAATYKGVEVMDSTEFCGTTCHTVMQPEHTAYLRSPHARVGCVDCHIGPGADWFVKSKLSGSWQLIAVTFDLYPRPIPSPIHNLRPARETCEQCHWPEKFVGDRLKVITRYAEDEKNTENKTVLLLKVGGIEGRKSHGIHWHVDPKNKVRYRSDEKRETIHHVQMTKEDGSVVDYYENGEKQAEEKGTWRDMDCVDCHNRPTHIYELPNDAIDSAMQQERIDRTLPYIRREGLMALKTEYASHEEARAGIHKVLTTFYRKNYPEVWKEKKASVEEAATELGVLYTSNVFPKMKVTWGTYPNHIGHENFPGCFRCHDGNHETADGLAISDDCDNCHTLLAQEEEDPEILTQLKP